MTDKKYAVVPWEVLEQILSALDTDPKYTDEGVWLHKLAEIANSIRAIIDKGPAEPSCHLYTWADHSTDTTYGYRQGQKPVSIEPLFRAPENQAMTSDYGEMCRDIRERKREVRAKFGVPCPECVRLLPKANPSILLPQQRCKIHGYRDPRPRTPESSSFNKEEQA